MQIVSYKDKKIRISIDDDLFLAFGNEDLVTKIVLFRDQIIKVVCISIHIKYYSSLGMNCSFWFTILLCNFKTKLGQRSQFKLNNGLLIIRKKSKDKNGQH